MRPLKPEQLLSSSFEVDEKPCLLIRECCLQKDVKNSDSIQRGPAVQASTESTSTSTVSFPPNHSQRRLSPQATSASRIRSRFLNRLGIHDDTRKIPSPVPHMVSCPRRPRSDSFFYTLKADHGKEDPSLDENCFSSSSFSSLNAPSSSLESRRPGVSFDASVTVFPIPGRFEYSERIRNQLWTPPLEIQINVARNIHEFAAEQWDWRQIADDEDMILWGDERIHPVHFIFRPEQDLRRQFCNVMLAQQQLQ
jgi:hypothetical protein